MASTSCARPCARPFDSAVPLRRGSVDCVGGPPLPRPQGRRRTVQPETIAIASAGLAVQAAGRGPWPGMHNVMHGQGGPGCSRASIATMARTQTKSDLDPVPFGNIFLNYPGHVCCGHSIAAGTHKPGPAQRRRHTSPRPQWPTKGQGTPIQTNRHDCRRPVPAVMRAAACGARSARWRCWRCRRCRRFCSGGVLSARVRRWRSWSTPTTAQAATGAPDPSQH